ncbi:MAG: amino acid ABC transporter permease [Oscillospiraceae bacterium]
MDFGFIAKYTPMYAQAAWLTLQLAFWGILLSVIVGAICSFVQYYRVPVARSIVRVYIQISRNTPLLIQLFFLYFALPQLGIKLQSYTCAVIGLTFLGGSYMAEALRGGLEAIDKGQKEAAQSIGLTGGQVMWYVLLPQALGVAMPALGANAIFLIKETSLVSVVALADLMFVAKDLIGMYYKTNEALFMLVTAYLIILLPVSLLVRFAERRLRYAGLGQ